MLLLIFQGVLPRMDTHSRNPSISGPPSWITIYRERESEREKEGEKKRETEKEGEKKRETETEGEKRRQKSAD